MANRQLFFMAACDMGDSLIAIDAFGVGIFRIDKSDMSSHLLAKLKNMGELYHVYQAVERYNDEVFFFPTFQALDNPIPVYHLGQQYVEYLSLNEINHAVSGKYCRIHRVGDSVWLFPTDFERNLVKFHLDTRQIEIVPQWREIVSRIDLKDEDTFSKISEVIEVHDILYHVIKGTNYVLGIHRESCQIKCYTIPTDKKFFTQNGYDGERFWIADSNHQGIISCNPLTQETQYFPIILPEGKAIKRDKWNKWISYILCGEKYLWIIPQRDNKIVKMDYEKGRCECIDIFPQEFHLRQGNERMVGMVAKKGNIADLYPFFSNLVLHLDLKNDMLLEKYEKIFLPEEWSETEMTDYQICHELETDRIPFGQYIDSMVQTAESRAKRENNCSNGENIWRCIRISGRGYE